MVKRKIEKIEDAEIVASKELKIDDSLVLEKVKKLRTQFNIFFVFFLVVLFLIFGTLIYTKQDRTEEIKNLRGEIKALTPKVTFESLDNKLDDRELESQKKTIILIDKAVNNLEEILVNKLNSVSDIGDIRKVMKLFEDELLKLQLQFDKKILELNKINTANSKIFLSEGRVSAQVQNRLEGLNDRIQQKFDILSKKLIQIEKEFLLVKNKFLEIEVSIKENSNKRLNLNTGSFRELEKSFVKTAYNALKMEAKRNIGGSPWSKFVLTVKSLFVFRSTEPQEGNSLDAVLSRAEHMLSLRDFDGCLKELDNLDAASFALFSEWVKKITSLSNTTN